MDHPDLAISLGRVMTIGRGSSKWKKARPLSRAFSFSSTSR